MTETHASSVSGTAPAELDSLPKYLLRNAERFGARHAMREKEYGIWQPWTWAQMLERVRALALGLETLGFEAGDALSVVGDNRPVFYAAMCATQALRGVPVPVYQDSIAAELAFVFEHAEIRFAFAEDQEQVDKLIEVQRGCPRLEFIVYNDPRGLRDYAHHPDGLLLSVDSVLALGRERHEREPDAFATHVARTRGSDTAVMLYTSGTTGRPKGVVLSHENVLTTTRSAIALDRMNERDEILAYLPLAWVGDHIFSYCEAFVAGFCVNCPESSDTVMADMREIGPTAFFAPPRIFETLLTSVQIRMEDAGWLKRGLYRYFMSLAGRVGVRLIDGRPVSIVDRLLYALGELCIYAPLKNMLGLSRARVCYTAGEAIGPDIFEFYRSIGINMKQLYGQTEASVFVTAQPDRQVKADTVGPPFPGVEIRIADDGEVLYRSPGVFQCYFKNEQATRETKTDDGWVHTGDAGFFDADGHLKIIDRARDVGRLADGCMFAPKYIENKLKFFAYVGEAVAFGIGREHVGVFINIDLEAVGNWAERNNIAYSSYQELAANERVYELIADCVAQVNADLATDEQLSGSQIKRFLVLHKELDADDGELTRTRKVRRGFIQERYQDLVDALFGDVDVVHTRTEVAYEDGRRGAIEGDVKIREARRFERLARAS
ncbi:MAG: AMP-binding protein [Gammaproteobacteria bacterium]|nr:AMP-binding protein [Gammaproteobacteria bacterium]